eukprot:m.81970 g.81970  ORF g.81970 m.81970 type:complete len:127 (+) comp36275_c0_seq3:511-891(+)
MDDGAECYEHMLNSVHHHLRHQGCEDPCSAPHCITHRKFAMEIVEQYKCPNCLSSSEPFGYNQLVYHVSVSALITQFQQHRLAGKPTTFGQLLCECGSAGQYHICQKVLTFTLKWCNGNYNISPAV